MGANGALLHSVDSQNDTWAYTYDEFSRIKTAAKDSGAQGFSYDYDAWGNRWNQTVTAGTGFTVSTFFDGYNHNAHFDYYGDGSVKSDGVHTYRYDAEERVITVDGTTTYTYGPDGSRVKVQKSSGTRDYVYRPDGQLSSIWSSGTLVKANIYVDSGKLGSYTAAATSFEYSDWTGSTRIVTNGSGSVTGSFTGVPFGLPSPTTGGSDIQAVSSLDWDDESSTGHAWARQYHPMSGQWLSPDPYSGSYDPTNPQSFNRYSYVGNNPMSYSDPLGLARSSDAPDPDGAWSSNSTFYSGGSSGCQQGDGDVCRAVNVALQWLWSKLSSPKQRSGITPYANPMAPDNNNLEANAVRAVFVGGLHVRSASTQSQHANPSNSRTDIVLSAGIPPKVGEHYAGGFVMYWTILNVKNGQVIPLYNQYNLRNYDHSKDKVSLIEDQGKGFQPQGETQLGHGRDLLLIPIGETVIQKWFVNDQQVQLFINGTAANPGLAWAVKLTQTKIGPVYTPWP